MARVTGAPWGRNALRPHRDEIAAGPDVIVGIGGRSPAGPWTVRLWSPDRASPLVELYDYSGSAIGAYRTALARLPETVRWRDCDVVVA